MIDYTDEMIYHAKRILEICRNKKTCKGCPFRIVEIPSEYMHCMFEERRHPYNWDIPGNYADAINKIRKDIK